MYYYDNRLRVSLSYNSLQASECMIIIIIALLLSEPLCIALTVREIQTIVLK